MRAVRKVMFRDITPKKLVNDTQMLAGIQVRLFLINVLKFSILEDINLGLLDL